MVDLKHALDTVISPQEGAGKRALITGLNGFTGIYVARELAAAGYRVFGTTTGPADSVDSVASAVAEVLALDLCVPQAVIGMVEQVQPDVVVHLAAISFVQHGDAEQIYRVNVVGTRNLLAALAASTHRASAVLLASSANIYGNASVALIDEQVVPAPANDYAVSKLAMEYMARLWMDRLPIMIVRPFNYTGCGQREDFLLPKIVAHFRRHAARIELGNLAIARDFSDVRMVARSYRRLLATPQPGEVFNVCSGRSNTLGEVIEMVAEIAAYRIEVVVNPAFVRANDVQVLAGNNAKLTSLIGPLAPPPLFDTLRWMFEGQ